MRTGAPLWRENAQKKLSYLKGSLNAGQWSEGIATTLPTNESASGQTHVDSDCSVDLFVMHVHIRSYSLSE